MPFESFMVPQTNSRTREAPTRMSLSVALDVLQELENFIPKVGAEIMRLQQSSHSVTQKPDGSPVTDADHLAESMILEKLRALTPEVPIIAEEEYSSKKNSYDVSSGQFWLVDALDGTREFIKKGRDFTVNIGLIVDNAPHMGIVHWPAGGITYSGLVNEQIATRIHPNGRRDSIQAAQPSRSLRMVSSKEFGNTAQLSRYLVGREIREHRHRASSIKFCEVAEGRADIYPRFGASCEWDTAAGHAVVLAAGGNVTTSAGQPLLYGKTDFVNSDFVVSGRVAFTTT